MSATLVKPDPDLEYMKDELMDDVEEEKPEEETGGTEWDYSQYYPEVLPLRRPYTVGPSDEEALPSSIGYFLAGVGSLADFVCAA